MAPNSFGVQADPTDVAGGAFGSKGGAISVGDFAFDLDLVSICLQAGLPTERAFVFAAEATGDRTGMAKCGPTLVLGQGRQPQALHREVAELVEFSHTTGVSLAPLLRSHAGDLGRREHRRRQIAAARLGVMLVVPLGVCVLPAFVLLGVAPVLITIVSDMLT